jgi:hypothetical protein
LPAVVAAVASLKVKSCLIYGEAVVCDQQGLAVFKLLRSGGRVKHDAHLIASEQVPGLDQGEEPVVAGSEARVGRGLGQAAMTKNGRALGNHGRRQVQDIRSREGTRRRGCGTKIRPQT